MPGRVEADRPAAGVLRLTLSHPERRGALDLTLIDALAAAIDGAAAGGARAILLTGDDGQFSSGYDLGGADAVDLPDFAARAEALVAHPASAALAALDRCELPVLAALGGHAIGGGLELALGCDLRLAAHGIRLGMPPARLGLVYSHTGLRRFVRVIGEARTRELFLLGRELDAPTAERWGLVNAVVPERELAATALGWARELAAGAPGAQRGTKAVLRALAEAGDDLEPAQVAELEALRRDCFAGAEFAEGVRAFAQKRPPRWPAG